MKNYIFKKDINNFFYSKKFFVFALFFFMIISILFAAKKTVEQQQQQYKDVTANFCEEGCTYRFPKELKPRVLSPSDKYPVVTLEFPFKEELIPIFINRKIYLSYPENYVESDKDKTPYIVKESDVIDKFYKNKYQYFYTDNQRKIVLRNNTFTIATEQKIEKDINLLYFVPSEFFSDATMINKEINRKLDSMKVKNTNE